MPKRKNLDVKTPEGSVVGWDICGNPVCHRHIFAKPDDGLSKFVDCVNHPVEPAYLSEPLQTKFKDGR